jgi:hypothetical protein
MTPQKKKKEDIVWAVFPEEMRLLLEMERPKKNIF